MKVNEAKAAQARALREAGLPFWYQVPGDEGWVTAITLPATAGLCQGLGGPSDLLRELGTLEPDEVPLRVETEGRWPTEVQFMNWRWLEAMDGELAQALLAAIHARYPALREEHAYLPDDVRARCLPEVAAPDGLRPLVALASLVLHDVPHATTPYLGAEFRCAWDEEHGLGVLLYGTAALAVGGADVAMDGFQARDHREALVKGLSGT